VDYHSELLEILTDRSDASDERWRSFSRRLITSQIAVKDLGHLFEAVTDYDEIYRTYVASPISVPQGSIIVAGSGKEPFKTFNVSTAAAILAAAAGVPVVKGVSKSVSAVSGALDILDYLGIQVTHTAEMVRPNLEHNGIAFVSYRTFCPRFFDRYDGVFTEIHPMSLFMPIAALCVKSCGFVHGLSLAMSQQSADAISLVRPDLQRGVVVGAEPSPGCLIDEFVTLGRYWRSDLRAGKVNTTIVSSENAPPHWFTTVQHRDSHRENTELVRSALLGNAPTVAIEFLFDNAALIIELGFKLCYEDARRLAVETHASGRATRFLNHLTGRDIRQ
jgi:anthranilate phosphoribosyltransferase